MTTPEFKEFIRATLARAIPAEQVEILVSDEPLTNYFLKAFTHKTFVHEDFFPEDAAPENFNYEILEKLGDRALNASFQMWMYDVIGQETTMLQPYSDIDKRYTGTDYLNILADRLDFTRWVFFVGDEVSKNMKEDVFEAFVGALVLAGDDHVAKAFGTPDIGLALAKRWIYSVLNTYLRPEIDITDVNRYIDMRSRVNEIWHFNKWPAAFYVTPKAIPGQTNFQVTLKSPKDVANLPPRWRNVILGVGTGETLALAKEQAAERGLAHLEANFDALVKASPDLEVRYAFLNLGKIRRWLTTVEDGPVLYKQLVDILSGKVKSKRYPELRFDNVLARTIGVRGEYSAQVRLQINGSWKNEFRGHGASKSDAIADAIRILLASLG